MPKKRTSAEANNGKETNEGSDPVSQQEKDNAKRAKLSSLSKTTLQDLPIQLLKRILVKAVAMEVKDMKLAKSVWKEKADLVISRLKNVSLHWSSILTTNEFLTEVHRILDGTAQETIRLEILHQSWADYAVWKVTTMKEEIFMICTSEDQRHFYQDKVVNVYDRNNMAEVKDVIVLPDRPADIEGCNVSNCVYVLSMKSIYPSIVRITKDGEHQFNISPWISDVRPGISNISVLPNGNLSVPNGEDPVVVSIYDANGSLVSSVDIYGLKHVDRVIHKSNGNLVVASFHGDNYKRVLTEIDTDGKIQRQYISSLDPGSSVSLADMHGRIVIAEALSGIELLDSELNPLDFGRQYLGQFLNLDELHYNSERNEKNRTTLKNADDGDNLYRFQHLV